MSKKDSILKELNLQDLRERLSTEREAYRVLRFAHAISPIENPNKICYARRMVARIQTLIREKEKKQ